MKKLDFLYGDHDKPITIKEAYNSTRFKQICALFLFGSFYGLYIASAYKVSNESNLPDKTLTIAGSIGAVCNGGSRIMWASLLDKFGFRKVFSVIMLIQLVISSTIF